MIKRYLENVICQHIGKQKTILIFGAHQVGKTTLLENLACLPKDTTLFLNGDESDIKEILTHTNSVRLNHVFRDYSYIVIDEAQAIPDIGITLKILNDKLKWLQVIASGSSAFELANSANEPLTGRKFEFILFPLSFSEMVAQNGFINETSMLNLRLVYGYYPEVVTNPESGKKLLKLIAGSIT